MYELRIFDNIVIEYLHIILKHFDLFLTSFLNSKFDQILYAIISFKIFKMS